jgi:hypothetical protein
LNVGLEELNCVNTELTSLPPLPDTLKYLNCIGNRLTELPKLPPNLTDLRFNHNNISVIPELPDGLRYISLHNNSLEEPFLTYFNDYRLSQNITQFKRAINEFHASQRPTRQAGRNLMTLTTTVGPSYPPDVEAHIGSMLTGKTGTIQQQKIKLKESLSRIPGALGASRKRKRKSRKSRKARKARKSRKSRANRK